MTFDQTLAFAGLAVGIAGCLLAFLFYRKTIRSKLLVIGVTSPVPLVVTTGDISVEYGGRSIKSLSRSYILLWNRGTSPIEAGDFLEPIKFSASAPLLKVEILDKDPASQVTLVKETSTISITLLRPSEAVMFVADIAHDEERLTLNVQMKSADMTSIVRWPPGLLIVLSIVAIPLLCLIVPFGFFVYAVATVPPGLVTQPPIPSSGEIITGISILAGYLAGLGILFFIAAKFSAFLLRRIYSPIVTRFSDLQGSAWTDRQSWKQLRKKLNKKKTT